MDDLPDLSSSIRSNEPGSFPWTVLHDRHPALLQQVRDAHPYPPEQQRAIDDLEREIAGKIEPLTDTADDAPTWAAWSAEYLGQSWYDVPFLWAENYFYRKLLAAVGYLEPGPWLGIDPFAPLKAAELAGPIVDDELAALDGLAGLTPDERLDTLLLAALWGNRADLSFLIGGGQTAGAQHLVADDRAGLALTGGRVVLVADNAGRELLPDLVLIDHLLDAGRADEVLLHVKPRPYFVSDATTADVLAALQRLIGGPTAASEIGRRLAAALRDGRLTIRADPFSVAPMGYQDLPLVEDGLRADAAAAMLTIMKGDLNYRRLVGDRGWPATSSFASRTSYFPGPVVALRTLKSNVIVGLDPAVVQGLDDTGTVWRTSGAYGLIQASPPR
jgi:hypothetical protein